jgi:uncharacterized protein YcbK (DUF882 family)
MVVMEARKLPMAELIAPRVEGELAFALKEDLQGPGVTLTEVRKIVTNPKNNSPHLVEMLHNDIFHRGKLEKPTQEQLDALARDYKNNRVVGAATATVERILERVKPVKP